MTPPNDQQSTPDQDQPQSRKQLIASIVFLIGALLLAFISPTIEIAWVGAILMLTIYLFAFEVVGVDVAAAKHHGAARVSHPC